MTIPAQLNHYTILHELGKGGMGEVYAAEDTRLHRRVAIKVLSRLMASDPERRQRFEREAQAIAALNHPNIVTIHSVEEADGIPFLTMELVEGRPLSEMIPPGGLGVDALMRVGTAVSDAIAAAHQRGITHRDLKPANVMVTADGRVKVLDFGLAKLREAQLDADGLTQMPSNDLTGEGKIIGTVAYMSPEQAEGKTVDPRSDIFSLGVVLHEMATGERPFKGDSNVAVLSAILKDTPSSITDLNPALPPGLGKIIRRSLAKDPSRRYQTAIDLRNELDELKQEIDSGITLTTSSTQLAAARRGPGGLGRVAGAAALAVVAALAFAMYWWQGREPATSSPSLFEADRFTRVTSSGNAALAALSPDGRYIAHVKNTGVAPALWMRQTATSSDVQIVPPAQVRYDAVSYAPDGDYVYYVTYALTGGIGTLYKVATLGGPPQRILEDVDSRPSFSPDRREFAFVRGAPAEGRNYIMAAGADGSAARQVARLDPPDQLTLSAPAWSPDGATILQSGQSLRDGPHAAVFAFDVKSGAATAVGGRWGFAGDTEWLPDGRSFIVVAAEFGAPGPQLWQVSYPSGERRRVTNDLNNYVGVSLATDAHTVVTVQAENMANLWVLPDADLSRARQVTRGSGRTDGAAGLTWSPDGRLVFSSIVSGQPEIWIANGDGSSARQITNDPGPSVQPSVSPDGRYVVFQKFKANGMYIYRMGLDGSDVVPITKTGAEFQPSVSADSRWVYYNSPISGQPITYKVAIDGGTPVKLSDAYFRAMRVSPDGALLLGVGWDTTARRSALATLPVEGGTPTLIPDVPVIAAGWRPGATGAGAAKSPVVTYADVRSGSIELLNLTLGSVTPTRVTKIDDNLFGFAWSVDGKSLAVARGVSTSDVVLITRKR